MSGFSNKVKLKYNMNTCMHKQANIKTNMWVVNRLRVLCHGNRKLINQTAVFRASMNSNLKLPSQSLFCSVPGWSRSGRNIRRILAEILITMV